MNEEQKVERIYGVLNSLNVHRHDVFRTIVFSDTVLVYNHEDPIKESDHDYIVWYSIEFAEDLHHRLTGQDVYFRAVLTRGEFKHQKMENLEAFYGKALISAYLKEKKIPSLGLFIDENCNEHNRYFRTAEFGQGLSFVYLNRSIEDLCRDTEDSFPIRAYYPRHIADSYPYLAWQVHFLADVYRNMRENNDPSVRTKFLTAWDFYERRYPNLLAHLVKNNFLLESICPGYDFSEQKQSFAEHIEYFYSLYHA